LHFVSFGTANTVPKCAIHGLFTWVAASYWHERPQYRRRKCGSLPQETMIGFVHWTGDQSSESRRCAMLNLKKTGMAVAAAALLAAATIVAPQPAEARGGAVAAGIIGGLAAGALIGAAAAHPYYGPGYYGPAPVYYGPNCWWQRERFWDGWGWRVRRVRVCN
jgi:hypothetical protein